jgi:putative endonuclease
MPDLRGLGAEGEDAAAEFLIGLGYTIVKRRFRGRHGEIDLIALDGDRLVFVEVKTRGAGPYLPEDAIGHHKIRRWKRTATEYLRSVSEERRECRFDVIAIDESGLRHHVDALRSDG